MNPKEVKSPQQRLFASPRGLNQTVMRAKREGVDSQAWVELSAHFVDQDKLALLTPHKVKAGNDVPGMTLSDTITGTFSDTITGTLSDTITGTFTGIQVKEAR